MAKPIGITPERHAAIFGPPDDIWGEKQGRKRKCKVCGGWHLVDEPLPHNCRPAPRPASLLSAPMIIGDIEPHVEGGVYIDSRQTQRKFMQQNGLVEFEPFKETAGTHKQDFNSKEYEAELVSDIKQAMQTSPENRPPPQMIEEVNEKATAEEAVSTEGMEIIGDDHTGPA